MSNQENMDIMQDEEEQEQEFISLYKALEIIYEKVDWEAGFKTEWENFLNQWKSRPEGKLNKLLGKGASTYLKKPDGSDEYNIPVKGVNCIAVLLNFDLKEELGREYGGESSPVTLNEAEEDKPSERKKYQSDVRKLFRAAFKDTDVAARLYLRSQLKLLFSGCSGEVQRKIAKAYNMKYIPEAQEAAKKIEVLKEQVDKLLESWDADRGTFHCISETCNMSHRYIVSELLMLSYKRMFKSEIQDAIAKLQP